MYRDWGVRGFTFIDLSQGPQSCLSRVKFLRTFSEASMENKSSQPETVVTVSTIPYMTTSYMMDTPYKSRYGPGIFHTVVVIDNFSWENFL